VERGKENSTRNFDASRYSVHPKMERPQFNQKPPPTSQMRKQGKVPIKKKAESIQSHIYTSESSSNDDSEYSSEKSSEYSSDGEGFGFLSSEESDIRKHKKKTKMGNYPHQSLNLKKKEKARKKKAKKRRKNISEESSCSSDSSHVKKKNKEKKMRRNNISIVQNIQVDEFDGQCTKKDRNKQWLELFLHVSNTSGYNNKQNLNMFKLKLTFLAREWYRQLDSDIRYNWKKMLVVFKEKYYFGRRSARKKYYGMRQPNNLSALNYLV